MRRFFTTATSGYRKQIAANIPHESISSDVHVRDASASSPPGLPFHANLGGPQMINGKVNLVGIPPGKLDLLSSALDISDVMAKDILRQVHRLGLKSLHDVTGIGSAKRDALSRMFTISECCKFMIPTWIHMKQ